VATGAALDGFVAGPNQSEGNPLGEGGERLHDWVVPLAAWRQSHDPVVISPITRVIRRAAGVRTARRFPRIAMG
jgi:hypothetical protein